MSKFGKFNYESYREFSAGKSLVSGEPIPGWDELPQEIRDTWDWAAVRLAGYLDGYRDGRLTSLLGELAALWEARAETAAARGNHETASTLHGTAGELRAMLEQFAATDPPTPGHLIE